MLIVFLIILATCPLSTEFNSLTIIIKQEHRTSRDKARRMSPMARSGRSEFAKRCWPEKKKKKKKINLAYPYFCLWSKTQLWFSFTPLRKLDQSTYSLRGWWKEEKCNLPSSTEAMSEWGRRGASLDMLIQYPEATPPGQPGTGWPCAWEKSTKAGENFGVLQATWWASFSQRWMHAWEGLLKVLQGMHRDGDNLAIITAK